MKVKTSMATLFAIQDYVDRGRWESDEMKEKIKQMFHFLSKAAVINMMMIPILLSPCLPDIPALSLFTDGQECTLKPARYLH